MQRGVFFLQRAKRGAVRTVGILLPLDAVEEDRRRLELIEYKQQRPEQQNGKLHGNFQQRIEHQAQPAFAQRGTADVALHLRLVGAEVGERKKKSAEQPGPERVTLVGVE